MKVQHFFLNKKGVVSRSASLVSLKETPRTTTTVKRGASLAQLVGCQTLNCKVAVQNLTRVVVLFLEQVSLLVQSTLVRKRPDMTEKVLIGMKSLNLNKQI